VRQAFPMEKFDTFEELSAKVDNFADSVEVGIVPITKEGKDQELSCCIFGVIEAIVNLHAVIARIGVVGD
jgi:hypothetical protein